MTRPYRSKRSRKFCGRDHKVIFRDEIDAKLELAKHRFYDTKQQRAYKCPFGNHWHLTTQVKKGGK